MTEWQLWLNSNETRAAIKLLEEIKTELQDVITDGTLLQEKSTEKISLDYSYIMGQVDGLRMALENIKTIDEESDDNQ